MYVRPGILRSNPYTSLSLLWMYVNTLYAPVHLSRPLAEPALHCQTLTVSNTITTHPSGFMLMSDICACVFVYLCVCVRVCVLHELTLDVYLYIAFLYLTHYKETIWAFCLTHKAFWVMLPSLSVKLNLNMSCWNIHISLPRRIRWQVLSK